MSCAVSVLMIVHNGERDIGRALASILTQTMPDFEVVIVDDGSTDRTVEMASAFAARNEHVRLVTNGENRGRAYSRNVALDEASGDYVIFVDADDFLAFDALERLLHANADHVHDIIVGGRRNFNVHDKKWQKSDHLSSIFKSRIHNMTLEHYPIVGRDQFITGKLYRRRMLEENGIRFSTTRKNAEDILYAFTTWQAARAFCYIPDVVYFYAQGNFLRKATPEKVEDAYVNYMTCVEQIFEEKNVAFRNEMLINICFGFEGLFVRASHTLEKEQFVAFLGRFESFLKRLPRMCLDRSQPRFRRAGLHILAGDCEKAAREYL